jgi:cobalt-zinc-cadmium efflux system membrane fusion protein
LERKGDTLVVPEKSPLREKLSFGAATNEYFEIWLPVPAVVEPDPSKFAKVFPPLAGRVAKLHVSLGDNPAPDVDKLRAAGGRWGAAGY